MKKLLATASIVALMALPALAQENIELISVSAMIRLQQGDAAL